MSRTITKADLVDRAHRATGLARVECADGMDELLELMREVLGRGEDLKLAGLGTFLVRVKGARLGRNPALAAPMALRRRRVVTFRPSQLLRQSMNRGSA